MWKRQNTAHSPMALIGLIDTTDTVSIIQNKFTVCSRFGTFCFILLPAML